MKEYIKQDIVYYASMTILVLLGIVVLAIDIIQGLNLYFLLTK